MGMLNPEIQPKNADLNLKHGYINMTFHEIKNTVKLGYYI